MRLARETDGTFIKKGPFPFKDYQNLPIACFRVSTLNEACLKKVYAFHYMSMKKNRGSVGGITLL